MASSQIYIEIEIEPIVKLTCKATACKYNLWDSRNRALFCKLKHIEILDDGACGDYASIVEEDDRAIADDANY